MLIFHYFNIEVPVYNNFLLFRPADPLEYLANFLLKNRPAANVEPVTQELQSTSA